MEPEIRIDLARPRDTQRIAEMSRDLIEHGLPWRWRPEPVLRLVRDPDSSVIVARYGDRICGFAIMSFDWKRAQSHLVLLAVEPAARLHGLGRALLRWLEVVARRGGIAQVGLEVRSSSAGARTFYRHLGYAETGRVTGYYQGREDAVKMLASLRSRSTQRARD